MKNSERIFYFFDCEVASSTSGVLLPTMDELVTVWKRYVDAGQAKVSIRKKTAHLMIGGIDFDAANGAVTMLVRMSDSQAPNAVYSNVQNGTYIEHEKGEEEGNDVGAHIVISTLQESTKPNTYCAIIEAIRGLNYRDVRRILNRVLHRQYDDDPTVFMVDDPRGRRTRTGELKRVSHLPRLELTGHPSESLVTDIDRGKLSGVVLVKSEAKTPVGGTAYLTKHETELRVAIDHRNLPQNVWTNLKAALATEATLFPTAKISFQLPNQPRAVTVKIDSITGNPVDELYIRSVRLTGINPLLANSSQVIVKHLIALAKPHLLHHRSV